MFNKFHLSTNVISGPGCISELAKEAKKITSDSIMIITDKGLRQAGIIDKIEAPLKEDGYTVLIFDEVEPNPSINTANKAYKLIIENNIKLVIAVGGGSSIDTSKSACMLATNGGDLSDYAGFDMFNETPIPFFAIPTTAGTGSEVTIVAVMSDTKNDKKFTVGGAKLVAKTAFLDPELTLSLPAKITAYTGIDALSHAIESYTSIFSQTITDSLNITAIKLIYENLPIAVMRGDNIKARENMLNASCIASMTCNSTYLGLVHAIASPICAFYSVPHGIACALLLPNVMQFNLPAAVDKFANIALALELGNKYNCKRELAQKTVDAVRKLCEDINIPKTLSEIGVEKDRLNDIAKYAANYVQARTNCRKATEQEILELLNNIYI